MSKSFEGVGGRIFGFLVASNHEVAKREQPRIAIRGSNDKIAENPEEGSIISVVV